MGKNLYRYSFDKNEITKEKSKYGAQWLHCCKAIKGTMDGIYKDTYEILYNFKAPFSNGDDEFEKKYLDFYFTEEQKPFYRELKQRHFKKHLDEVYNQCIEYISLESRTFPPKVFDELLKK